MSFYLNKNWLFVTWAKKKTKIKYLKIGIIVAASVASIAIINEMFPSSVLTAFKPTKTSALFLNVDLNQKIQEGIKIRDACIPVSGFDVDDVDGVLIIYFTKENESKYVAEIDNIIKIPYVIKTTERPPSGTTNPLRDAGCFIENMFDN